jgi:hypothetical protein
VPCGASRCSLSAGEGRAMTRRRLPNRRGSITFDVEALGLTFTVTASRFNDGSPGEIFIQA